MGRKCGKKKTKNGILDDGMDVVENIESCPLTSIESPRSIQSNNNDLPVSTKLLLTRFNLILLIVLVLIFNWQQKMDLLFMMESSKFRPQMSIVQSMDICVTNFQQSLKLHLFQSIESVWEKFEKETRKTKIHARKDDAHNDQ